MEGIIEERIIRGAGGKFHLTSLLQKRLREYLIAGQLGARRPDGTSILDEVLGEIREGNIALLEEVDITELSPEERAAIAAESRKAMEKADEAVTEDAEAEGEVEEEGKEEEAEKDDKDEQAEEKED